MRALSGKRSEQSFQGPCLHSWVVQPDQHLNYDFEEQGGKGNILGHKTLLKADTKNINAKVYSSVSLELYSLSGNM